jgi:uncharacterized protein YaiI (UPF0178 family)
VIGSRPTGWWRDRPGAARQLTDRLRQAAGTLSGPVVVVLEGQARQGVAPGTVDGVEVVHAPGEGDDAIVALAADSPDPVVVVTADRGLAERVRQTGGDVVGPSWLLERLDQSAR